MALPKQIEEAAELAEKLHTTMFNQEPETSQEQPQEEAPAEEQEEDSDETVDEEPAEEVEPEDDIEELKKFKARYLSLQGKYNKEVPQLHKEIKEFKQSVFDRLEQVTSQKKEEPSKEVDPRSAKLNSFKEEYGEEFVDTLRLLIEAEAERKINESLKPVREQVLSVEDTQVQAAQQSFKAFVTEHTKGDWEALWNGDDPKFLEFLQKPDPSGLYTYADLIQHYNENWDADRLSRIFNIYFEETQPKVVKQQEKPNPVQTAMVAPSRTNTHTTPQVENKQIWTQDKIKEFQKLDRMGKYTSEESKAMWDDLLSAMSENRIR